MNSKRTDYISPEELFIGSAILSCLRSKDPNTRHGVCIINPTNNRVISLGYNGFPFGCSDDEFPWGREGEEENTKYPYVIHAERNAIYNTALSSDLQGSTLFLFSEKGYHPCSICMQSIIQSGIRKIILAYQLDPIDGFVKFGKSKATEKMIKATGIEVDVYPDILKLLENLELKFREMRMQIEEQLRR